MDMLSLTLDNLCLHDLYASLRYIIRYDYMIYLLHSDLIEHQLKHSDIKLIFTTFLIGIWQFTKQAKNCFFMINHICLF